ncbi:MAG: 6,7-dimethyl-8-ribityllumazine synthase [Candidatus Nanopelagicales bacterium]|nr:6,7-dimethyl-8-ribityllumazine synthase [Candidatus Nanopelagicales bacterium]
MSGQGAPRSSVQAAGARIAIVAASWHTEVMDGLVAGALRASAAAGATATVIRVTGSFELPIIAKACAASDDFDVVVALGVVIRGDTPHFDFVCAAATDGLAQVALDFMVPVGFGLLTCDTDAQALDRAGLPGSREDKGAEATEAALLTWQTVVDLSGER